MLELSPSDPKPAKLSLTLNLPMDFATFGILALTGFTACAEFGSYAFVHPVIRDLPPKYHIKVEQGLLRTFGTVMPILMTLCVTAAIAYALADAGTSGPARLTQWIAAALFAAALAFTIILNVPINLATAKWDADRLPENWKDIRNKWEKFQAIRSWLLLLGFISLSAAVSWEP